MTWFDVLVEAQLSLILILPTEQDATFVLRPLKLLSTDSVEWATVFVGFANGKNDILARARDKGQLSFPNNFYLLIWGRCCISWAHCCSMFYSCMHRYVTLFDWRNIPSFRDYHATAIISISMEIDMERENNWTNVFAVSEHYKRRFALVEFFLRTSPRTLFKERVSLSLRDKAFLFRCQKVASL